MEQKSPVDTKKQKKEASVKTSPKKDDSPAKEEPAQKASKQPTSSKKTEKKDEKNKKAEPKKEKPRLTSPDLEFDFDRSQLRDPRATPGRTQRPQYEEFDMPEDLKADISSNFHIPKPEKPKGRLNWMQKDELFRQAGLLDPSAAFHDLYVCHKKGRDGSPTCDKAGFQLDWQKVDDWMKPQPYSKSRVMSSMNRALEKDDRENKEICKAFFQGDGFPTGVGAIDLMHYIKDHISKDLNIPWHQIGPAEAKKWGAKFEKKDYGTWWHEPNMEEKRRMLKMMGGASLRKNI